TLMQLGDQIPTVIGNEHLKLDAWSWNRGADLFQQLFDAFTGVRRNDGGVRLPVADAFDDKRISHVSLVHHDDLGDVQRVDFAQHSAYCLNLPFRVRVGPVYDVQDQIRIGDFLQGGAEGFHQLSRQVGYESNGVGQGVGQSVLGRGLANGWIKGGEQRVLHQHPGVGQPVQQRRLASVGVAGNGYRWNR